MRLAEIMSTQVRTISPQTTADVAMETMSRHGIHHLVVLDVNRVVGVVSHRDLGGRLGPEVRRGRSVGDLMVRHAVVATPDTSLKDAANLLRGRGIGCLPVVQRSKLVGIITAADLLELIGRGQQRPASRTARPGSSRRARTAA